MKKLTLEEWEKKYIAAPIEQFNEKNTTIEKIDSDPDFFRKAVEFGGMYAILGHAKDRPGFTLMDQAMRWGAWAGFQLELLDTFFWKCLE